MAEALGVVGSIIAIVQISTKIVKFCKGYVEDYKDYPSDVRRVLLEVSSLKTLFENLKFFNDNDKGASTILANLDGDDGPVEGCHRVIKKLTDQLASVLPQDGDQTLGSASSTKRELSKKERISKRLKWPFKAQETHKLLGELSQYKATITLAFSSDLVQDMKDVKKKVYDISERLDSTQTRGFREWLVHTNPSSNHNSAYKLHEPETGEWVPRLPEWSEWLNQKRRCLWIHGIPGAGKTVLFSHLVSVATNLCKSMKSRKAGIAYYYCYHARNQDEAVPFLRWVLAQLTKKANIIPEDIYELYDAGMEPSLPSLLSAIEFTLENFDIVYICLDAIDESLPRNDLLRVLRDFMTDPRFDKIKLLATSREYLDIENTMSAISTPISMSNPVVEEDIRRHVSRYLASATEIPFKSWEPQLKTRVQDALARGAQGMFRWAVCQLDLLRRKRVMSTDEVDAAIKTLPKSLDETYERIFLSVEEEDQIILRQTLRWIHFFESSWLVGSWTFSISDLVEFHWGPHPKDYKQCEESLRYVFGCLVRVSCDESLSLAHYTVREFLTSSRIIETPLKKFSLDADSVKRDCLLELLYNIPNRLIEWCKHPTICCPRFRDYAGAMCLVGSFPKDSPLDDAAFWFLGTAKFRHLIGSHPREALLRMFARLRFFVTGQRAIGKKGEDYSDTELLLRLFLMGQFPLADVLLEKVGTERILAGQVTFDFARFDMSAGLMTDSIFDTLGRLLVFAKALVTERPNLLQASIAWLIRKGQGLYDPSRILFFYTRAHLNEIKRADYPVNQDPTAKRLLSSGADPSWTGFEVTALQLAVGCREPSVVKLFLDAGADPNAVSDIDVSLDRDRSWKWWGVDTNRLRGRSPLNICRRVRAGFNKIPARFDRFHKLNDRSDDKSDGQPDVESDSESGCEAGSDYKDEDSLCIEKMLLEAGARDFRVRNTESE